MLIDSSGRVLQDVPMLLKILLVLHKRKDLWPGSLGNFKPKKFKRSPRRFQRLITRDKVSNRAKAGGQKGV